MSTIDINKLVIANPKRNNSNKKGSANWYSYYAGFSSDFSTELIKSSGIGKDDIVLDPWNGGGTTTSTAASLGLNSLGYDLNPVMIIAAKAQNFNKGNASSILPLLSDILKKAKKANFSIESEPLEIWFHAKTCNYIRSVEHYIQKLLVNDGSYTVLASDRNRLDSLSDISAFFYVALFNTLRGFLTPFYTSNPTWIKKPKEDLSKLSIENEDFATRLRRELSMMLLSVDDSIGLHQTNTPTLQLASSEQLPTPDNHSDFIISSPPYCTRIDYAVATMAELAVLGISEPEFKKLRQGLIGSSTIWTNTPIQNSEWGETCNDFLSKIQEHDSKASKSYYLKNHLQYFDSIHKSISELVRVMRTDSICAIVVQDSYYKEVHNNLPRIFGEMFKNHGVKEVMKKDFVTKRNKAGINPSVKKYRNSQEATESVLIFRK